MSTPTLARIKCQHPGCGEEFAAESWSAIRAVKEPHENEHREAEWQERRLDLPCHAITWTIDRDSLDGNISCEAPKGARCRLTCAEECGAESWPCYSYDEAGNEREHEMRGGGYCNVVEFIGAGGRVEEFYDGAANAPVRSGPIELRWDGDSYLWRFAPESGQPEGSL